MIYDKVQIAPSLLSADFGNLERDVRMIEQAKPHWLHVDVMDGHFVPNLSIGVPHVKALKKITNVKLDVHLMIANTEVQLDNFLAAGADIVTIHLENANGGLIKPVPIGSSAVIRQIEPMNYERFANLIKRIQAAGAMAGVAINPNTNEQLLAPLIKLVDVVMVMSVHPGFGAQSFIDGSLQKIADLARMARELKASVLIEVDGGITVQTAPAAFAAGADVLVAGNAVFAADDPLQAMRDIALACAKR